MISNKDLFLRTYKRQQSIDPDKHLPSSQNVLKKIPLKKIKAKKPRKITVNTRYGEMSISI